MKQQVAIFVVRWVASSFGLWLSMQLLGGFGASNNQASVLTFLIAGLVFSVINALLRPIIIILSLPAILLTLGLFILIVNGFMVYISLKLIPDLSLGFGQAIIVGIILSIINYVVSGLLELRHTSLKEMA